MEYREQPLFHYLRAHTLALTFLVLFHLEEGRNQAYLFPRPEL